MKAGRSVFGMALGAIIALGIMQGVAHSGYVRHDAESGVIATELYHDPSNWMNDGVTILKQNGEGWAFKRTGEWIYYGIFSVVPVDSLEWYHGSFFITKSGVMWYLTGDPVEWTYWGPIPTGVPGSEDLPHITELGQNYPNPFNPSTTISLSVDVPISDALIDIFDVQGQRVRTIPVGDLQPIEITVTWDGKNEHGEKLPSGVYFYQLVHSNGKSEAKKAVLLK